MRQMPKSTIAVISVLLALSASCYARWTGPMPFVPGTNYTDGAVIHQDHTQYIIPKQACDNFRKYEICWRTMDLRRNHDGQNQCEARNPWRTDSPNWNQQIQAQCQLSPEELKAAQSQGAAAAGAAARPAPVAPRAEPEPIRTYTCQVPTSTGMKRRTAWVRSVAEARDKAYESYRPIMTSGKDSISCAL